MTKFRTQYTKRQKYETKMTDRSRTKQQFKAECDINRIVDRIQKTGQLPDMIKTNASYGDFSNPMDYQESMNLIIKANEQFAALPAKARERFQNSPQKFLEFTADPENIDEMIKLGLATKREEPPEPAQAPPEPPKSSTPTPE